MYISSASKFNDFNFEGIFYKYIPSKISEGIIEPKSSERIRITDLERTVIDSIKEFEKIGGLEELLQCLNMLTYIDEYKLIKYLELYDLQVLYQKVGYILEHYKESTKISDSFFDLCKNRIGKSTRYLMDNASNLELVYNGRWQLIVPQDHLEITEQGGGELV